MEGHALYVVGKIYHIPFVYSALIKHNQFHHYHKNGSRNHYAVPLSMKSLQFLTLHLLEFQSHEFP